MSKVTDSLGRIKSIISGQLSIADSVYTAKIVTVQGEKERGVMGTTNPELLREVQAMHETLKALLELMQEFVSE